MVYSKHSYQGTAKIVEDVCGRVGLMLVKKEERAPDFIDPEQYKRDLARLRSLAMSEKRAIEGSVIERIVYRFFGQDSGEGLNTRISEAKKILGELEVLTERYATYEGELTDSYYSKRKKKLEAAKNVMDCESIIEKLDNEKKFVFPRLNAAESAGLESQTEQPGNYCLAEKEIRIDLDRRLEAIDKDISMYRDSAIASALVVKYTKKEIEQLDEYRKHVKFIVDNTRRTIICGGMFIDHVENCKNYLVDGEEVLTRNMDFQRALFDIKKGMENVIDSIDEKMEIFGVYMGLDPFKSLFSSIKRRRRRLRDTKETDNDLIQEALMELQPEEEKKCREE